jgi:hypothetical protein
MSSEKIDMIERVMHIYVELCLRKLRSVHREWAVQNTEWIARIEELSRKVFESRSK